MATLLKFTTAQLAAQEQAQFDIQIAKLIRLFNRSGARDEWRTHFLDELIGHVAAQGRDLQDSIDEGGDEHIHETQRTFVGAAR